MTPALRKLGLASHVTASLAWLGAVLAFLALSIAGLRSPEAETVRGVYLAMNMIGLYVIVPLSLAALMTGVVQSLGTHWGLFRYYWVVAKLGLTFVATLLLLLHQFTAVEGAARRVSKSLPGQLPEMGQLGIQLIVDSAAAIVVLLLISGLGIYKPWGLIRRARGATDEPQVRSVGEAPVATLPGVARPGDRAEKERMPRGVRIFIAVLAAIVTVIVAVHLAGGGIGNHGH